MQDIDPSALETKIKQGLSLFLKLYKKDCGACRLSEPAIERLEKEYAQQLEFVAIDTEAYPEMHEISDSEVLPFFFIFKDEKMKAKQPGFKGLKKMQEFVKTALSDTKSA